jgi:hypothetical protein
VSAHDDDTTRNVTCRSIQCSNTLNAELNTICYLLTLLEAHPIFHISRIRVKVLLLGKYKDCVFFVNYYKFEITEVWDFIFGNRLLSLYKSMAHIRRQI